VPLNPGNNEPCHQPQGHPALTPVVTGAIFNT
jgi:hypothetical protein